MKIFLYNDSISNKSFNNDYELKSIENKYQSSEY